MNGDEFLEVVKRRRSVRRFKPDPIPDETLEKILEAARWAMSGANGQPWEFIVVTDPDIKQKIAEAKDEAQRSTGAVEMIRVPEMRQPFYRAYPNVPPGHAFADAPVLIFVCSDPRTAQATVLNRLLDRRWVIDENISNATFMLNLGAAAYGLAAQWITVTAYFESLVRPILGVPPLFRIHNLVPIGYPLYQPKIPFRRELKEMVHHNQYDMSKYRSHEEVQEFLRNLREVSKAVYPLK